MQKFVSATLLSLAAVFVLGTGAAYADKKVTICHVPPGNPENRHTISVGESAVSAHMAHGDQLGECRTGCLQDAGLCDDENACTMDSCNASGECEHDTVNCDDGNSCTADRCSASEGCLYDPDDGRACDDGNACTSGDTCGARACQGTAIPGCCAANDDCEDEAACTDDLCVAGRCSNEPVDCSVPDDKCVAGFCDAEGGCGRTPVDCDDRNVCTDDSCASTSGCYSVPTANPPEPSETTCDDGVDNDCDGAVDAADPDCSCDSACGDGVVQEHCGEQCDEGLDNGDTKPCTASCRTAVCGDALVCSDPTCTTNANGRPEECDDGNEDDSDGCDTQCFFRGTQD